MDQDKKEQFVDTLLEFVNKNKNKTIRAVFQAEKIGARLDKDIGDVLVKAIYGRIGRTSLRRTLENLYDRNSTRYERDSRFMDNLRHFASERLPLIERDKDGVVETPQNLLSHDPSVLDPDKPQPGNIYHIDGIIGMFKGRDTKGHTAIEIAPYHDGRRRIVSSTLGTGVYIKSLDDELNGRTFEVTEAPNQVDNEGITRRAQALVGLRYDYSQLAKQNDPNKFTCTDISCEVSRHGGNAINTDHTGKALEPNEVYYEAVRQGHRPIHWQNKPYRHPKNRNNDLRRRNYRRQNYPNSVRIYNPYSNLNRRY